MDYRADILQMHTDGQDPVTGILRGRATLAKEGVYRYSDGATTWAEYVPISTLTDPAWLDSLKLAPVTLDHPAQMVTADNARALAVGGIGDSILRLGSAIASPIAVWARDAVEAAQTTHREISLGYHAEVEDRDGTWNGQRYDRVQVKRRANHVALVQRGRHGPDVRLLMDSADIDPEIEEETTDAEETYTPPAEVAANARRGLELREEQPPSNRGGTEVGLARARQLANRDPVSLSTIKRMASFFARHEVDKQGEGWGKDSKGYQAWLLWGGDAGWAWAKSVIRKAESRGDNAAWQLRADEAQEDAIMQEKIDALTAELAAEKARADKAEADRDAKTAKLNAMKSGDKCDNCGAPMKDGAYCADSAKALVAARVELETIAAKAEVKADGKSDRQVRLDVLAAWGVKLDDTKSDDYIAARLDAETEHRAGKRSPMELIADAASKAGAEPAKPELDANSIMRGHWGM